MASRLKGRCKALKLVDGHNINHHSNSTVIHLEWLVAVNISDGEILDGYDLFTIHAFSCHVQGWSCHPTQRASDQSPGIDQCVPYSSTDWRGCIR